MTWIERFIEEIDALLEDYDRDKAADLIKRMRRKFMKENEKIEFGMNSRRQMISAGEYTPFVPSDDDYIHDLKGFRARLLEIKDERDDPHSVHYTKHTNVSVQVDVMNYISIIQELPDSTLSEDDKMMLSGMLTAVQNSEGEKKKTRIMEVVKWLGDKAVDVAIAAIPALASMI